MAISRAQLAKELEPGLNALFGMEYDRYENQHGTTSSVIAAPMTTPNALTKPSSRNGGAVTNTMDDNPMAVVRAVKTTGFQLALTATLTAALTASESSRRSSLTM